MKEKMDRNSINSLKSVIKEIEDKKFKDQPIL
jgi:hypothetical protein